MKNTLIRCLVFILIVVSMFACACNTEPAGTSNNDNNQEVVTPEEPPESQPELKSFDITEDNYTDYLNINITQSSQTSTLINALYRIKYISGPEYDVWGLNPNLSNASSCKLIKTKYTQITTFSITIFPKQSSYRFSGVIVLVSYKNAFTSVSINEYGLGSGSFVLTETLYNLHIYNGEYYRYNLDANDTISAIAGRVYYYE